MIFRDEIVENIKEIAELRLSDLITDEELLERVESLLFQYRTAHGFPPRAEAVELPLFVPPNNAELGPFFAVILHGPEGQHRYEFASREITMGRSSESDIVLPRTDISRKHARLILRDGRFILLDLKSENGTYINGTRVSSPQVVQLDDKIAIGDYQFYLEPLWIQQ